MKRGNILLVSIIILMLTFVTYPTYTAIKKTAQTSLQFLKVGVGARAAAMGGAFMMVGNDANSMFYNPAGIAAMRSTSDIFISRTEWIGDIKYNAAAFVQNFGDWGNGGISFISSDYGEITGTRVSTNEQGFERTGKLEVGAYAIGVSYARQMTDKFTIGGQVKYANQRMGSSLMPDGTTKKNKVSGLVYDFGTIYYPGFRSFHFGMTIRNFSQEMKYEQESFELPLTFCIAFAMDIFDFLPSLQESQSFVLAVDAVHPRDYTERIHVGGEYWYMDMIALRAGYKFNYDEEGLSAGAGIKYAVEGGFGIKIDYSYSDFGVFNAVNRISIGASF